MTVPIALTLDTLPCGATRARLTLQAPRANALEPALLGALSDALDGAERAGADVVTLAGAGRNFCSGGDVARFAQAVAEGRGIAYARDTVPRLQDLVLRLLAIPAVVGLAGRGAITGGGAGFLFAADLAVLSPDAFVQPYYTTVGFAPDGGWGAILPDRIGPGAALSIQIENRRLWAEECLRLGLAAAVADDPGTRLDQMLEAPVIAAAQAAKRLVWDAERLRAVASRLDAETEVFLTRIDRPETIQGMARFLRGVAHA